MSFLLLGYPQVIYRSECPRSQLRFTFFSLARFACLYADLFRLLPPESPLDPEYVGCYQDDKQDRVLSDRVEIPGMTAAVCREHCSDKDALYYATQVGVRASLTVRCAL